MQQRRLTFIAGACVLKFCEPNMSSTCRECGAEGHMDDRIGRRAANGGVDRTAAEMAAAIIPQLLPNQGLRDEVRAVGARAPQRHLAMLPSPASRLRGAVDRRACLGTRVSA